MRMMLKIVFLIGMFSFVTAGLLQVFNVKTKVAVVFELVSIVCFGAYILGWFA